MKLTITMDMDNAAFEDGPGSEAARILRTLAQKIDGVDLEIDDRVALLDVNGNRVGSMNVTE
jgi:hypothetical protein